MNLRRIRQIFAQELCLFGLIYPDILDAKVGLAVFSQKKPRDICLCFPDKLEVFFHASGHKRLDDNQVRALVRHELAHLCEPDLTERQTDALAEDISDAPIYYGREDLIQTLDPSGIRPRPRSLPK